MAAARIGRENFILRILSSDERADGQRDDAIPQPLRTRFGGVGPHEIGRLFESWGGLCASSVRLADRGDDLLGAVLNPVQAHYRRRLAALAAAKDSQRVGSDRRDPGQWRGASGRARASSIGGTSGVGAASGVW